MTTSPVRSTILRQQFLPPARIQFENGQCSSARLQAVFGKGGLLRVLQPLSPGAIVELMISTRIGPVLAIARLLNPCSAAAIGLQAFRFVVIPEDDLRNLHSEMA